MNLPDLPDHRDSRPRWPDRA